ncbi:MAG: 50S ribosomal protein L32 [Desulfovibrio sp.]|nr:50S ribosomal protein L32 [Desulfovibrio sp.]
MAVQQNKKSRSKKGMRRSHDHIAVPNYAYCTCGNTTLPYRACPYCGKYNKYNIFTKPNETETE